ncbi:MAG: 2,5-diketo-D-gluconic acid reductase B [candidate division WS6 bacterium OLB20]|uniref:2,5-diketo-D-gluconic acid reductase B n=1 Tax=candidate division WS6 bacterium OLB20 TaxID=1617426 RepID=A0A136M181_9BACT|nr:MAG: 2,5-diketo-D-gluconic acid reductase B [candidate division WS6 bacterium OLB20]
MDTIAIENKTIPALGFGTWKLKGQVCRQAVEIALEAGYRHIDTADVYGNHAETGAAIRNSGLDRSDLFVTSKVWRDDLEPQTLKDSTHRFLDELQADYLDLLLIHWPNSDLDHAAALTAMHELKTEGLIRHCGVSNFTIELLQELRASIPDDVVISNNQFELHPTLFQKDLVDYCKASGITVTAYSPIGQGDDLKLEAVTEIAAAHNCTPAQADQADGYRGNPQELQ